MRRGYGTPGRSSLGSSEKTLPRSNSPTNRKPSRMISQATPATRQRAVGANGPTRLGEAMPVLGPLPQERISITTEMDGRQKIPLTSADDDVI
jgi:hypothetical protein